jgi:hypothetical protein
MFEVPVSKGNVASGGLLVEADHVSSRIAKPGGDFGGVGADGLHDFAAMSDDGVNGGRYPVHHDVKEEAGLSRGRAPEHPCAAYFAVSSKAVLPSPRLRMFQPKTPL